MIEKIQALLELIRKYYPNLEHESLSKENIFTSLSAYKNQLLIGTQNEELFLKNIENQNEKLIFKGENKHEIYLLRSFKKSSNIFNCSSVGLMPS